MTKQILHARWVAPVSQPPIENGRVVIESGMITAVEKARPPAPGEIDLGDAILLPGFVNAHTHLELTRFHEKIPYHGSFVRWVQSVAAFRWADESPHATRASIKEGLRQSLAAGVTAVADIGSGRETVKAWFRSPIHVTGFLEVLGMGEKIISPHDRSFPRNRFLLERAVRHWRRSRTQDKYPTHATGMNLGLSPHAPYSTDTTIYSECSRWARMEGGPLCTHLAETREELEFLASGTGPFRDLLDEMLLWDGSFTPPESSPVEYMARLDMLRWRPILAHVNYVSDSDLARLIRANVAYCPRTHHFFGHAPHRYREMLDIGVNVCIGTDSLASNPSLSVLDELRFIRRHDRTITDHQLLEMGTVNGARALRMDEEFGAIEPGLRAHLTAIPMRKPNAADPLEDLLHGTAPPSRTFVNGQEAKTAE